MKNSYKAQLAAETGIQQGIEVLKNKIINDPDNQYIYAEMESNESDTEQSISSLSYDLPEPITSTSTGSNYTVSFTDTVDGTPSGAKIQKNGRYAIDITSIASVNGSTKTINAYIDERNIENKYFSKLFATDVSGNDDSKIQIQDNSNSWPSISTNGYTNATSDPMDSSRFKVSNVSGISTSSQNTVVTAQYNDQTSSGIDLTTVFNTLYTYIGPTGQGGITLPTVDKSTLTNVLDVGGYYNEQTIEDNLKYAGVYKMIFVHGNAHISNLQHTLVNYVIYVDGTLTIDNSDITNNSINLLNCSIYARNLLKPSNTNISMTGMGNSNSETTNKVLTNLLSDGTDLSGREIGYVTTAVGNGTLSLPEIGGENFTSSEKSIISGELNENLDTYYNGLQFTILAWEEQ